MVPSWELLALSQKKLLNWPQRIEVFSELPGVFGVIISFPSYEILFLASYSPSPDNVIYLVDWFLYFWVDVPNILLERSVWRCWFQ
jgi:hypothetical protein